MFSRQPKIIIIIMHFRSFQLDLPTLAGQTERKPPGKFVGHFPKPTSKAELFNFRSNYHLLTETAPRRSFLRTFGFLIWSIMVNMENTGSQMSTSPCPRRRKDTLPQSTSQQQPLSTSSRAKRRRFNTNENGESEIILSFLLSLVKQASSRCCNVKSRK